jgi:PST family polysaccharide transporter
MTAARLAARAIGLASTLVLVRLLAPADFGLVALATAVAAGLELMTLFGFDTALVQRKEIARDHYDSAWTLNVLLGAGIGVVLVVIAIPVAHFYQEPRLEAVMYVLAAKYAIERSTNPGIVDFRRKIDFRPEFLLQIVPKVAGILVAIPLAFWWRDYRALLAGMLVSAGATWLQSYTMHPHRPRWCLREARGLYLFSRWLFLNNFITFLRNRGADLIIGRTLGPAPLGMFAISYEVSTLPSSEMVAPINRVLFPGYVQLVGDPERLRSAFRTTLGMIALITLPASIGIAAVADPLVRVLLGDKWLDAIPLVPLLATAGAISSLQTNTGPLHNALGQPRIILLTGVIHIVPLLPILLYGASAFGLVGVAWALLIHAVVIALPATYLIVFRTTPVRFADVMAACWRPMVACCAMYLAVQSLLASFGELPGTASALLGLLSACTLGAVSYGAAILALWMAAGRPAGTESYLREKAQPLLARFRSQVAGRHQG